MTALALQTRELSILRNCLARPRNSNSTTRLHPHASLSHHLSSGITITARLSGHSLPRTSDTIPGNPLSKRRVISGVAAQPPASPLSSSAKLGRTLPSCQNLTSSPYFQCLPHPPRRPHLPGRPLSSSQIAPPTLTALPPARRPAPIRPRMEVQLRKPLAYLSGLETMHLRRQMGGERQYSSHQRP